MSQACAQASLLDMLADQQAEQVDSTVHATAVWHVKVQLRCDSDAYTMPASPGINAGVYPRTCTHSVVVWW